ncbi:MAG: P-loop NTPase fold protein, partial [Bacillota bacterium]
MLSDQPITSAKDDLLGRAGFAKQIASALLAAPSGKKGSFTIGLCGSWGSGKTSVVNMVVEALYKKGADCPIIVQFNPWLYPAEELLPGQFLQAVSAELKKPAHGRKLCKAGRAMGKYAAGFLLCTPGFKYETVAELRGETPTPDQQDALPRSVLERKEKVIKLLKKQKQKIFILMDDIDRLSAARIGHALQLVKAVADFPRMVYLLAYDQDVVVKALDKELGGQGWDYMKKFIQAQFTVPAPEKGKIAEILMAYFNTWLQMQPGLNFDRAYFTEISPYLFSCITSIRDVYRFVNTFRVRYQALGNEVNFVDLLAVTALQLHVPQALPWIQAHRDDLLRGGGLAFSGADLLQRKRLKEEHRRMITALNENDAKTLIPLIGLMFPRYGKNVLDVASDEVNPQFVRMRRICCEEFFDLYFTQSTENLTITQEEIFKTIRDMDAAGLRA